MIFNFIILNHNNRIKYISIIYIYTSGSFLLKSSPKSNNYYLTSEAKLSASSSVKIMPAKSLISLSVGYAFKTMNIVSTPLFFVIKSYNSLFCIHYLIILKPDIV